MEKDPEGTTRGSDCEQDPQGNPLSGPNGIALATAIGLGVACLGVGFLLVGGLFLVLLFTLLLLQLPLLILLPLFQVIPLALLFGTPAHASALSSAPTTALQYLHKLGWKQEELLPLLKKASEFLLRASQANWAWIARLLEKQEGKQEEVKQKEAKEEARPNQEEEVEAEEKMTQSREGGGPRTALETRDRPAAEERQSLKLAQSRALHHHSTGGERECGEVSEPLLELQCPIQAETWPALGQESCPGGQVIRITLRCFGRPQSSRQLREIKERIEEFLKACNWTCNWVDHNYHCKIIILNHYLDQWGLVPAEIDKDRANTLFLAGDGFNEGWQNFLRDQTSRLWEHPEYHFQLGTSNWPRAVVRFVRWRGYR